MGSFCDRERASSFSSGQAILLPQNYLLSPYLVSLTPREGHGEGHGELRVRRRSCKGGNWKYGRAGGGEESQGRKCAACPSFALRAWLRPQTPVLGGLAPLTDTCQLLEATILCDWRTSRCPIPIMRESLSIFTTEHRSLVYFPLSLPHKKIKD